MKMRGIRRDFRYIAVKLLYRDYNEVNTKFLFTVFFSSFVMSLASFPNNVITSNAPRGGGVFCY